MRTVRAQRPAKRTWWAGVATLLMAWTTLWGVKATQDVLAQTRLGRGQTGSGIEASEILEVIFVAAYSGVRWIPGALILLVVGYVGYRKLVRPSS